MPLWKVSHTIVMETEVEAPTPVDAMEASLTARSWTLTKDAYSAGGVEVAADDLDHSSIGTDDEEPEAVADGTLYQCVHCQMALHFPTDEYTEEEVSAQLIEHLHNEFGPDNVGDDTPESVRGHFTRLV